MTEQEIFERLRGLIRQVMGIKLETITIASVLVSDLGAESIDLLDLSFLIEDTFGIVIEPNEFKKEAKARIPDGVYEKNGFITEEGLIQLRRSLPEVDQTRIVTGFRKADVPSLLTVGVFVHLIQRKLMVPEA